MKKSLLLFEMISVLIILTSCNHKPLVVFENNECLPPCWAGIIPGQTTIQDAKLILSTTNEIDRDSLESRPNQRSMTTVYYDFNRGYREFGGNIEENLLGKVESISFGYVRDQLYLSEVIDLLGEPDKFITFYFSNVESPFLFTIFIYSEKSITINAITNKFNRNDLTIERNMSIETIDFVNTIDIYELLQGSLLSNISHAEIIEGMNEWTGYGDIKNMIVVE